MQILKTGFIAWMVFAGLLNVNVLPAAQDTQQPEMTVVKADFIPGEKTILYDDFSDMAAGDAPAHFKVRGSAPELRVGAGIHELTATQTGSLFPNITSLPNNFTHEAEITMEKPRNARSAVIFYSKTKEVLI